MAIYTKINKEWSVRLLLITVAFTGFGFYCLYDGKVGYPHKKMLYELTHTQDEQGNWRELDEEVWKPKAIGQGLDPEKISPKDFEEVTDGDITAQFIMAGICFPIGVLSIGWLLYHGRRKPWVDEEGFKFTRVVVPLESIKHIDKDLWKSKGIAVLHYEGPTATGAFKLDDWKYKGADAVLEHIEQALGLKEPEDEAAAQPTENA